MTTPNTFSGDWAFAEHDLSRAVGPNLRTAAEAARESEEARLAARRVQADQIAALAATLDSQVVTLDLAQIGRRMAGIGSNDIQTQSIQADRVYYTSGPGNAEWRAISTNPYKQPRSENLEIHPRHGGEIPNAVTQAAHLLRNWMIANQCEMLGGMTIDRNAMFDPPRFTQVEPPATSSTRHRWGQADRNGVVTCLSCHGFASARHPLPVTGCSGMTPQEARNARGESHPQPSMRPMRVGGHSLLYIPPFDHYSCAGCGGTWRRPEMVDSLCHSPR